LLFIIQNEFATMDETNQQTKLTTISKGFEETILCLAKSMRMQEEKTKVTLCARSLLVCCSSTNLLSTDQKLWLKFLYLIFDKQQNEVENYLKNNIDLLMQISTTNQRLQKVITSCLRMSSTLFSS
jgi:hypothetical protein